MNLSRVEKINVLNRIYEVVDAVIYHLTFKGDAMQVAHQAVNLVLVVDLVMRGIRG